MRQKTFNSSAKTLCLTFLIACAAIVILQPALSQEQPKVTVKKSPVRQSGEISGAELFHNYCTACHGRDGKGNGPATPGLKTPPPDLTLLAKKNGGKYPADRVMYVLSNESEYAIHGSKEMPIWGPIFRKLGADQNLGRLRARNVTDYLKWIQEK